MRKALLNSCASVAVLGIAALAAPAFAADAPAAAAADKKDAGDTLAEIVVTASTGTKTKLDTSVSISSIPATVVQDFHPMSEGDLLRLLPGLQPQISGPGGNGNFAVRGLPVATGGAPFVQLQEDGLPLVLYGDLQFGNNDYWTKSSPTDERIDAIRGGTAATLASQAPGAVVNYISVTGKGDGGYVQIEKGVNYDYTKLSFLDRGSFNDSTYYNIGGFYDVGHGPWHAGYNVSNSYVVKGNVTKEFDDGKGFFRLLFKVADTQEPNDTGGLVGGNISGGKISGLGTVAGFNLKNQSNYSIYNTNVSYVDFNSGGLASTPLGGISTQEKALQAQLHYKFDNGITFDYNGRYAQISGGFASNFFSLGNTADLIGSSVNGGTVASAVYAAGPNAGKAVTEQYYDNNVEVFTRIRAVDSFANDAKLNWKGDIGSGVKANLTAGWFFMNQRVAMDWHPSKYNSQASGDNPAPIDLLDASGNLLTANGYYGYNNNWGSCCARTYDYTFTDNAPYADLILDYNGFEFDGSLRDDINHGSGAGTASSGVAHTLTQTATNPVTGASQQVVVPYYLPDGTTESINYDKNLLSYSVGTSYKFADNVNVFARTSRGTRFNSDRLTFGGNFTSTGALSTAGQTAVADYVYQTEIGVKNRGTLGGVRYTLEFTGFYSHFNITTYELNPLVCKPLGYAGGTCPISDKYKTTGFELYSTLRTGGFNAIINLTWNAAKKLPSTAATGQGFSRSDRIPDLSYSLAANYDFNDTVSAGVIIAGVTGELDGWPAGSGVHEWPGSAVVSANVKVHPVKNLELGLNAYNLFNALAVQGAGGVQAITGNTFVGSASAALGRTVTASAKFHF